MRRVVFDCDRCGKKDLTEVFGLYNKEGEGEAFLLDAEDRTELMARVGYEVPLVEALTFSTLRGLEEGLEWVHYCRRCFMTVSDNLAKIANVKKPVKPKKPKVRPEPEPTPEPAPEPAPKLKPKPKPKPKPAPKPTPEPEPKPKPAPKAKAAPKKPAPEGLSLTSPDNPKPRKKK